MLKATIKYISFLFLFFFLLELLVRFIFPNFNENQIFYNISEKKRVSKGINTHFDFFEDILIRVPEPNKKNLNLKSNRTIWVLGDSVTNGYGVRYNQTYYSYLKDFLSSNNYNFNIIPNSFYGANLNDIVTTLEEKIQKHIIPNDIIIYQFHYNDLTDLGKSNFKFNNSRLPMKTKLDYVLNKTRQIRYEYLNKSTLIKVLSHYASTTIRKTSGNCSDRGLDALGPYSYSYWLKGYEIESKKTWDKFEKDLIKIKNFSLKNNAHLLVLISPISIQIKYHENINKLNYDTNCGNKDARQLIVSLLEKQKIIFADPTEKFNIRSTEFYKENNFTPLFIQYDTAHPNDIGHYLMGLEIYQKIKSKILN